MSLQKLIYTLIDYLIDDLGINLTYNNTNDDVLTQTKCTVSRVAIFANTFKRSFCVYTISVIMTIVYICRAFINI